MGWPVAHSRSPVIHNHWIAQYGLRGTYALLPVQPDKLTDAIRGLPALGFAGCNITIPHKQAALDHVEDRGGVRADGRRAGSRAVPRAGDGGYAGLSAPGRAGY